MHVFLIHEVHCYTINSHVVNVYFLMVCATSVWEVYFIRYAEFIMGATVFQPLHFNNTKICCDRAL